MFSLPVSLINYVWGLFDQCTETATKPSASSPASNVDQQEAGGRRQEVRGKVTSPGHTRRRCELAHSISWGRPASPAGCDLNILSASTHTVAMSGHSLTHSSVHPPHQAGVWLLIIISINLLIFFWPTDSSALTI